jgi:hypothetical protein
MDQSSLPRSSGLTERAGDWSARLLTVSYISERPESVPRPEFQERYVNVPTTFSPVLLMFLPSHCFLPCQPGGDHSHLKMRL